MTELDRGTLAKIDRKVLSGLDHDETWQMVRVPASEAEWSAWKRYCDALGISMGRAIAALMQQELASVVDDMSGRPLFLAQLQEDLDKREVSLDVRERRLEEPERWISERERRIQAISPSLATRTTEHVGRNDPCPCGSGLKYKRCHGGP